MEITTVRVTGSQKPIYLNGRHQSLYARAFARVESNNNVLATPYASVDSTSQLLHAA